MFTLENTKGRYTLDQIYNLNMEFQSRHDLERYNLDDAWDIFSSEVAARWLLPCEFVTPTDIIECYQTKHEPCAVCACRPAVAVALLEAKK